MSSFRKWIKRKSKRTSKRKCKGQSNKAIQKYIQKDIQKEIHKEARKVTHSPSMTTVFSDYNKSTKTEVMGLSLGKAIVDIEDATFERIAVKFPKKNKYRHFRKFRIFRTF